MTEKEPMEFDLEDILREFAPEEEAHPEEEAQAEAEPAAPEKPVAEEEPVQEEEPTPEPEEAENPEEDPSDDFWDAIRRWTEGDTPEAETSEGPAEMPGEPVETSEEPADTWEPDEEDVKLYRKGASPAPAEPEENRSAPEAVETTPQAGDTIRLNRAEVKAAQAERYTGEDTQVFAPIEEERAAENAPEEETPENEQEVEPFSEKWEPHYEEPIGEYVPPEPIVFRPRSRLTELKKKLVAGPERLYYALVEEGLGKYQVSIFLSALVVILSVAAVCLNEMGMVQPERMRLLVFGELFAMLIAALLGSERLLEGFVAIFKGKFNLDSLMILTFVACVVDAVFCLQEVRVPFCAAFCLEMTMSIWAEYERRDTELGQLDTLRKAVRLNRVAKAPDCYEGRPGFYVMDGEVEDFMDTYQETSQPEKTMNRYALIALLISAAVGVFAGIRSGVSEGFRVWAAALLAGVPATSFICQSRPAEILERRFHKLGVVLCGWQGVKAACGSSVVPLTDNDLFPSGSVKVNGVKFYSQRDPDETVEYGSALIEASGMGIANLFTQLRESRYGRHYEVENFRYYENGGIGGEVCGEPVLVGCLSFLQEMGVELPDGARVSQAVYVAVDGELCGVFAMAFGKLKGVGAGLGTLCGYRKLTPVLATGDFLLSESFIRAKFNVNTRRFAFPSMAERQAVSQWQPDPERSEVCALTTQDGLASTGYAITGARALHGAVKAGTWLHILGGIVGMLIILALTIVDGGSLLTPANLLLLELCWAVPGLLITEWTRRL